MKLTQAILKEYLWYTPETGEFVRLKGPYVGQTAGTITKYGYRQISVAGKTYRSARLAFLYMTGRWPRGLVDHENTKRSDDRWGNLREATSAQNRHNSPRRSTKNSDLPCGVQRRPSGRFTASIGRGQTTRHLGTFDSVEAAYAARVKAEVEMHGGFRYVGT